ncbi:MAG: glycosyltransferase [Myxococcota bacterium]
MKVLHVDTATELRGGQRQLAWLLAGRPGDAWAGVPDSPLAKLVGPPALPLRPGNDPRNAVALRGVPYDLVAAHTSHAHDVALLCGLPVVVHRRVDFAIRHAWKYRRVAGVVAVSEGVARVLRGAGIENVHVVHDGVPTPADGPRLDLPGPLYGAVGALVPHKGHVHLVDAMREVPGTLVIAGEGPLRGELERRAGPNVRLLGHVDALGGLLRSLDAFVHPSVEEGMGQVILEAMACGCRVVGSRVGGIPEAIGDTGLLVPPGDPGALALAMREVLTQPSGRGVVRAAEFSVERMVAGTTRAYERILAA